MDTLLDIDWQALFIPEISLLEMFLRGTIVYLVLFILFRVLNREGGDIGIADLLVVVLVADAAQNAMASTYNSITEGLVLVTTILFWNFTIDWLGYHYPRFGKLIYPSPITLVKNGRVIRRNMRREMLTDEELMSQLRQQGVENLAEVKKAYIEGDGHISVITEKNGGTKQKKRETSVP